MDLITIVLPIFLVVALGYGLRLGRFVTPEANAWLSRFVFYIAAPALLLRSTAGRSYDWSAHLQVLLVSGGVTVLVAAAVYLLARRLAPARRGVLAQGCHRSNTVFFGLPLVLYAFGEPVLGAASILIAFLVLVENLLSVLVLTLPHQRLSVRDPRLWWQTAARIARNPLILSCAGGILLAQTGLRLPTGIDRALALIGGTAAPLGLFCVGAGLELGRLRSEIPATALCALVRLGLHPALAWATLAALGFAGADLGVPVLILACPTAVVTYIMAREMEGDEHLAAAIVIGTTVASLPTLLVWLAILLRG